VTLTERSEVNSGRPASAGGLSRAAGGAARIWPVFTAVAVADPSSDVRSPSVPIPPVSRRDEAISCDIPRERRDLAWWGL
jgi:hypothetical protein